MRKALNSLLLLVLISTPMSISSLAKADPVMEAYRPKLVIFIIHGFLGGPHTFCDLDKILERHLGPDVLVKHLRYPTKGIPDSSEDEEGHRDNVNIPYFTKKIYEDIHDYFKKEMLPLDTNYAMIAHSQGGIIFLRLMLDCYEKGMEYCTGDQKMRNFILPSNLTHFFSIMSPFWGSSTASYLKENTFYRMFFPNRQLENLSIGSDAVSYNRDLMMDSHSQGISILRRPEIINIAANASPTWLESILRQISDLPQNNTLESDFVVPMPSARMDFLYFDYTQSSPLIGKTDFVDYYYSFSGNHVSVPMSDRGLACVNAENYLKTPTFPIIRKHLASMLDLNNHPSYTEVFDNEEVFPPNVESFILELQFELPKDYPKIFFFDTKHVKVSPLNPQQSKIYKLQRENDFMNSYYQFNQDYQSSKSYVTYFTTGTFLKEYSYVIQRDFKSYQGMAEENLIVNVNLPWFKPLEFETIVSPSYTSFAKVKLEPRWQEPLPVVYADNFSEQALSIIPGKNGWNILNHVGNGDFKIKSVKNLPPLLTNRTRNVCYLAKVPDDKKANFLYYKNLFDTEPFSKLLSANTFKVYGRAVAGKKSENGLYEFDRVFVTDPQMFIHVGGLWPGKVRKNQIGGMWMNTKNIRIYDYCD